MSFNFSCTKCGKCCKGGGPALSIAEIFKYQDVFISGLIWSAYHVDDGATTTILDGSRVDSRALDDHFSTLCGGYHKRDGDKTYPLVYPTVTGYDMAPGHGCTALKEDNSCGLQADKPAMCRAVPFDPVLPEAMQGFVLRKFKFDCMTEGDSGDGEIYSDGRITDAGFRDDYGKRLAVMREDAPMLGMVAHLIRDKQSSMAPSVTEFVETTDRAGHIETSMLALLFALVMVEGKGNKGRVLAYLDAQERLIKAGIDTAIQERNKSYRERTAAMREYLRVYAVGRDIFEE